MADGVAFLLNQLPTDLWFTKDSAKYAWTAAQIVKRDLRQEALQAAILSDYANTQAAYAKPGCRWSRDACSTRGRFSRSQDPATRRILNGG